MFKKASPSWTLAAASFLKVRIYPIMALSAVLLMCVTSIDYFDCSQPRAIETMSDKSCEQALGKSFEVLTKNVIRELSGLSCEVNSSEWHYRCGVFFHLKLVAVPQLMRHVQVTIPHSCRMSRTMEYAFQEEPRPCR